MYLWSSLLSEEGSYVILHKPYKVRFIKKECNKVRILSYIFYFLRLNNKNLFIDTLKKKKEGEKEKREEGRKEGKRRKEIIYKCLVKGSRTFMSILFSTDTTDKSTLNIKWTVSVFHSCKNFSMIFVTYLLGRILTSLVKPTHSISITLKVIVC